MAQAHTPGPWRVGPVDDTRVEDANGNEIAQIDGEYNQPETWPIMEANARLIAAAPDLLEATAPFVGVAKSRAADAPEWRDTDAVSIVVTIGDLRAIAAAHAKAKGGAE